VTPTRTMTPTPILPRVCGSVGTNGDIGGYVNGNALCVTASGDSRAHLCAGPGDIDRIIKFGVVPTPGVGRIIGLPPGATEASFVADCKGARSSSISDKGVTWRWNVFGGVGSTAQCDGGPSYFCCCN
jgi:hypothetical protein